MSRSRTHDELAELLGAYALDAVDDTDGEREAVRLHLLDCARCRAEVAQHREVAALLAHTGEPAPAAVWDRITAAIEGEAPPAPQPLLRAVRPSPAPRPRWWSRPLMGAAAAAIVVIAALGWLAFDANRRLDDLEGDRGVAAAMADALRDPASTVVDLEGGVSARAVLDDGTYQLWGATGGELVSLGVLGRDPADVVAFEAGDVDALALSVEDGPQVQPLGPQVAIGEV
jgi:anti-sigma factor RsiW